jgi:hypothetical protein
VTGDLVNAEHEALKLTVRRGPKPDTLLAATISALATGRDLVGPKDELLHHHAWLNSGKMADRDSIRSDLRLSLPALGMSSLAMQLQGYELSELVTDSVYCPIELLEPTGSQH